MAGRSFEPVKDAGTSYALPKRSTENSAGYDFYSAEEFVVPSFWGNLWRLITLRQPVPTLVKTNIKAKMRANEALLLFNRSSNPIKYGLVLANGVGLVDSDYYGNKDNDGNICFAFYGFRPFTSKFPSGMKIGQGMFITYLKTDDDRAAGKREGGFGSTGS